MSFIKNFFRYFFKGVGVIINSKVLLIGIFCLSIFLLNKTLCYKEEIIDYERESLSERVYTKSSTSTDYYYEGLAKDTSVSKDIAASSFVSCINSRLELDSISDELRSIIDSINSLFNESDEYFSFLYKDIYTGFVVSYNEEAPIFTASSIKAPAMIYLYEMASDGKIDFEEMLTYTEGYYSDGSGVLKNKEFNTSYDIETLISYSILESDNVAYSMLMNRYGRENILEFWKSKGTKNIFTYNTIWGVTSAKDASIYMQELYDFYLKNDEYGNRLMNYFKNAQWKILTNKDGELNTANKGGWSGKAFHDVAIVFESNPYILVVMSNTGEDYSQYTYLFNNASKLAGELHSKYWEYKLSKCSEIKLY